MLYEKTKRELERYLSCCFGRGIFYQYLPNVVISEGVFYIAQRTGFYWVIDAIISYQTCPEICDDPSLRHLQFWELKVNKEGNSVSLCCQNTHQITGEDYQAIYEAFSNKSFPLEELALCCAPRLNGIHIYLIQEH